MDGKQVLKLLQQHGWQHARTRGSHHIMKKPGYLPIVVPVHGKKERFKTRNIKKHRESNWY